MPYIIQHESITKDPNDPEVVGYAEAGDPITIEGTQGDFYNIKSLLPDAVEGWVPKSVVSFSDPPGDPIVDDDFARECWVSAIYAGVNPHYLMAVAQLRSGLKNDQDAVAGIGPFRLLQTEWDADWNAAALGYKYIATDIYNWRSQCGMFGLMVLRTMQQMGAAAPSAGDLYLAQVVGTAAATALKSDPTANLAAVLSATATANLPKGNPTAAGLIARIPALVKAAGAVTTGQDVIGAIAGGLQNALDGTRALILAGGQGVLDDTTSPASPTATAAQVSKINVTDVNYDPAPAGPRDIDAWIAAACAAAGLPNNDAWKNGYETLCKRESSYDPNAINKSDSNAHGPIVADGYPQGCSRGLAQCIPTTFAAYHVGGTSTSVYDPVANIAASMQYVRARYHVSDDGSDLAQKVQQADPSRPPKGY